MQANNWHKRASHRGGFLAAFKGRVGCKENYLEDGWFGKLNNSHGFFAGWKCIGNLQDEARLQVDLLAATAGSCSGSDPDLCGGLQILLVRLSMAPKGLMGHKIFDWMTRKVCSKEKVPGAASTNIVAIQRLLWWCPNRSEGRGLTLLTEMVYSCLFMFALELHQSAKAWKDSFLRTRVVMIVDDHWSLYRPIPRLANGRKTVEFSNSKSLCLTLTLYIYTYIIYTCASIFQAGGLKFNLLFCKSSFWVTAAALSSWWKDDRHRRTPDRNNGGSTYMGDTSYKWAEISWNFFGFQYRHVTTDGLQMA